MNYSEKENYITVNSNPDSWRPHANFKLMQHYSHYIKGNTVDIGCNHGACTLLLLDYVEKLESITGIDMNFEALQIAFNNAHLLKPSIPVNFIAMNFLENSLESNTYDFLMTFHILEHIYPQDSIKFVSELYRILKPGGYLLLSIPYDRAYPDPCHVAFYNVDSLCSLFEECGFVTIEAMKDNRWTEKNLLTAIFFKS
jgi:2-polyprenyl-3-methyl-5-hydroxy-6-metoxy-1,4-benzoquinol methylase